VVRLGRLSPHATRTGAGLVLGMACVPPLAVTLVALAWWPEAEAWRGLLAHPTFWVALRHSVLSATLATALAWLTCAAWCRWVMRQAQPGRLQRALPTMLATPHVALAVGVGLWLAPSGWLLRLFSPWATGFEWPPGWSTTQDPWALSLALVLWLKEAPFLCWVAAAHLQHRTHRQDWTRAWVVAQTLGHGPGRAFALAVWPQLAPRLRWALLAVWAYGVSVVDVALVMGPTNPPTLAVWAWQDLHHANASQQAVGVAATWVVAALALAPVAWWWLRGSGLARAVAWLNAAVARYSPPVLGLRWGAWLYAAVWLALSLGSVMGPWPFPDLLPSAWSPSAWVSVLQAGHTLSDTVGLAMGAASLSVAYTVLWLECVPPQWQRRWQWLLWLPLVLPQVFWAMGLHGLALRVGAEGQWWAVCVAHAVMAVPYVWLVLAPAWQRVPAQHAVVMATLGRSPWAYRWHVKWPMLMPAVWVAWAMGYAVGLAQYLPTLAVGAGRLSTVTTEAVALSAGGQRVVGSAYALVQMLLPLAVFACAYWAVRARRVGGKVA
jgi:putative thiamine transport system permease protein